MEWVGSCLLITTEKTTVITNFNPDYIGKYSSHWQAMLHDNASGRVVQLSPLQKRGDDL